MSTFILAAQKSPYLIIGLIGAVLVFLFHKLDVLVRTVPDRELFLWQVISGVLLTATIVYQWYLLLARICGFKTQSHYQAHRWVGAISTALFALHAVSFGYAWTNALAIIFCLSAITGFLNKEIIGYKSKWAYHLWYWMHVTLSVNLLPLIAVHIWVALAFEGS